jgi:hypothetical protein
MNWGPLSTLRNIEELNFFLNFKGEKIMVNNLSSIRPSRGGDSADKPGRMKPLSQPRDDSFRKLAKERRPSKEEEEEIASEEQPEAESSRPSLFELSKSKNATAKGMPGKKGSPFEQLSKTKSSLDKDQQLASLNDEPSSQEELMLVEEEPKEKKLFADEETPTDAKQAQLKARSTKQPTMRGEQLASKGEKPVEKGILAETGENALFEPDLEQPESEFEPDLEQPESELLAANADKGVKDRVPANELNRQQAATLHAQRSKSSEKLPDLEESSKKPVSKKEKSKSESGSEKTGALEERAKLAVNASIQAAELQTDAGKTQESQQTSRASTIREIAAQIVERIQVMKRDDLTTTLVTLRHPPILEGATISLTTSDHAKREFNISFANLSPEAKLFIDRKLNEDSLTATLERKGIIVHMLTTTTQPETLIKTETGQPTRDQEQQREQREGKKDQSQEEETER